MEEKFIGLILAISSSLLIGSSFIITKLALNDATHQNGGTSAGDNFAYLKSGKWWAGMLTMVGGEFANFAAYSFAPAILVTPLGAGSVCLSAVLSHWFLKETLGIEGKMGILLCIMGSLIIILHSPEERQVNSVDEIIEYAIAPGFLIYTFLVIFITLWLIYKVAPVHGKTNMLVYITICSLIGSVSVMAAKAFGIALKLTFEGNNQMVYFSTYFFIFVVVACAVTQINYFNKALAVFSTNRVTPVYYVFFTTATIVASVILFQGFNDADGVQITSAVCGFVVIFVGVILLNTPKKEGVNLSSMFLGDKLPPSNGFTRSRSVLRDDGLERGSIAETHLLKQFPEDQSPQHTLEDEH